MAESKPFAGDLNTAISEASSFLVDDSPTERKTPHKEYLDTSKLDYSPSSLKIIDQYLDKIQKIKVTDEERFWIMMRCGAYCGEVIRRNSSESIEWLDRVSAIAKQPKIANLTDDSPLFAVIMYSSAKGFFWPMAKVIKFLDNGPEDSLWGWGQMVLSYKNQK